MMDRCTFLGFKTLTTIHCHYKAWKSQDIFLYNSDCICLKEESHIHLGWLEGVLGDHQIYTGRPANQFKPKKTRKAI